MPGDPGCCFRSAGFCVTRHHVLLFSSGAGAAGGGAGGDDQTAPVSVHHPPARDGHVQPKREYSFIRLVKQSDTGHRFDVIPRVIFAFNLSFLSHLSFIYD